MFIGLQVLERTKLDVFSFIGFQVARANYGAICYVLKYGKELGGATEKIAKVHRNSNEGVGWFKLFQIYLWHPIIWMVSRLQLGTGLCISWHPNQTNLLC
jgi:hypothetical protein